MSVPAFMPVIMHSAIKRLGTSTCLPWSTPLGTVQVPHVFGGVNNTIPAPAAGLYLKDR